MSRTHHATFLTPLAVLVALRSHGWRRGAALACWIIWMAPVYTLAKVAAGWVAGAGALVADLRPVSVLLLFSLVLVRPLDRDRGQPYHHQNHPELRTERAR